MRRFRYAPITVARYEFWNSSYEFSQLAAWPCGSAFFWAFTDWTTLEAARPGQFDIGRRARRQAKLCALLLARGGACRSFHESFYALSLLSTLGLTLLHHVALTLYLSLSLSFLSLLSVSYTRVKRFRSFSSARNPLPLSHLSRRPATTSPLWSHNQGSLPREEGHCIQFRSQ